MTYDSVVLSVFHGPVPLASSGHLLEMEILGNPDSESESLGIGPRTLCIEKHGFKKHWFGRAKFHLHLSLLFHFRQSDF